MIRRLSLAGDGQLMLELGQCLLVGTLHYIKCWDIHEDNKAYTHLLHLKNDKFILG